MTGKNRKFCYENHNLMSMKSRKQTLKTGVYQIFCLGIKRNDENTDCIKCGLYKMLINGENVRNNLFEILTKYRLTND